MSYAFEIALVMATVAAACAVPGTFLVLRKMAMTADAIGHVILFGIVVAYLIVRDLASPWLMVGAAASGVLTVALVEVCAEALGTPKRASFTELRSEMPPARNTMELESFDDIELE